MIFSAFDRGYLVFYLYVTYVILNPRGNHSLTVIGFDHMASALTERIRTEPEALTAVNRASDLVGWCKERDWLLILLQKVTESGDVDEFNEETVFTVTS